MPIPVRKTIRLSRLPASLCLGIALLLPLRLLGAVQPVQPAQAVKPENQPELLDLADAPREFLSEKFVNLANEIDRFFGGDRNFQESNQSVFQMDITRVSGYAGNNKLEFSGRAKLHLPTTEKRLHLLVETDADQNVTGETKQRKTAVSKKPTGTRKIALAARYEKEKEERWRFSTDAGVQLRAPLEPFTRARASYSFLDGKWRKTTTGTVFWFNSIGAGESTQFDLERILSEPMLFRSSSNATWLHNKQNFDLRQDLSIFHTLNDRSALLYQASAFGITHPQVQLNEYVLLLVYRYRLHRDWMFFEISPQLHFPRDLNFRLSPQLNMRLEMLFDEKR